MRRSAARSLWGVFGRRRRRRKRRGEHGELTQLSCRSLFLALSSLLALYFRPPRTGTWNPRHRPATRAAADSCGAAAARRCLSSSSMPSPHRASAHRGAPGSRRWSSASRREGRRLLHRHRPRHRRCPTWRHGKKRLEMRKTKGNEKKSDGDFTKRRDERTLGYPSLPSRLSVFNPWKRRRRPENNSRETSPGSKVCCLCDRGRERLERREEEEMRLERRKKRLNLDTLSSQHPHF